METTGLCCSLSGSYLLQTSIFNALYLTLSAQDLVKYVKLDPGQKLDQNAAIRCKYIEREATCGLRRGRGHGCRNAIQGKINFDEDNERDKKVAMNELFVTFFNVDVLSFTRD